VSETSNGSIRYQVVYSEFVRNELKKLIARAQERGLGSQVLDAVREMDRRLHTKPQFGEPLIDLSFEPGQLRMGTVAPLVVKYALYENRRLVTVTIPITTLPYSDL
jgi:hypothetical protein